MKIATIVGARPQFIKAAPVSRELRNSFKEVLLHTGQHYDYNMSKIFFEELDIPLPDYNLAVGSASHGKQTGKMLIKIEEVILKEKPDAVIVYGDTNSTLAGALVGSKLLIPVIHIEAGLRSFNKAMPEEQNRILTDHISELLLCPTATAVNNLKKEGIVSGVKNVGDVMYDATLHNIKIAREKTDILEELNLTPKEYILATVHRAENTNNKEKLMNIVQAFNDSREKIVLPLHPRTKSYLAKYQLKFTDNVKVISPVGYLNMLQLEANAKKIITDSGGVQKESFFLEVPCITLRDETEWIETVDSGWNILVGDIYEKIIEGIKNFEGGQINVKPFGNGNASKKIVKEINNYLS